MTKPSVTPLTPTWRTRLDEARQRMVFEPTPSGAKPYATTLERLAETLDAVEVTSAIAAPDSPTDTLARALAIVLRELVNARMYERNMTARFETGPDRIDEVNAKLDLIATAVATVLKQAAE